MLMTKLRALLEECGIDGSTALTSAFGCYALTLPAGTWIDVEAAADTLERAERALAAGDLGEAHSEGSWPPSSLGGASSPDRTEAGSRGGVATNTSFWCAHSNV